jgi:arylsulfatase
MDILPTVARLANATLPTKPLDGINIWPMLAGDQKEIEREALLYFDNVHLQCVRWKNWKLHLARYSSAAYSPAPQGGRKNLLLRPPELYNLAIDPDESYDVSADHRDIVDSIRARAEKLLAGFPADIQQAYKETQALDTLDAESGRLPRARPQ